MVPKVAVAGHCRSAGDFEGISIWPDHPICNSVVLCDLVEFLGRMSVGLWFCVNSLKVR